MKSVAESRTRWIVSALSALLALLVWAVLPGGIKAAPANQGAELFKGKCAGCHGPDGKGQTSMGKMMHLKDLGSADVQKMTNAQIYDVIAKGKSPMPGFGSQLSKEQINELVTFIRDLGKKEK